MTCQNKIKIIHEMNGRGLANASQIVLFHYNVNITASPINTDKLEEIKSKLLLFEMTGFEKHIKVRMKPICSVSSVSQTFEWLCKKQK